MSVEYRLIPKHPGYRAGSDGTIWSCWKQIPLPTGKGSTTIISSDWHQLRPGRGRRGYLHVVLKGRKIRKVHQLVLEAFVGPSFNGEDGCHYPDTDPANNRPDNLRWDTRKGNMADAARDGTTTRGTRNHHCKLTKEAVNDIRMFAGVREPWELANMFNISVQTVRDIQRGRSWAWLTEKEPANVN